MTFTIDLESTGRQLPTLQLSSRFEGDANPARHMEKHEKAWEVGSLVLSDYLIEMGLSAISQRISNFEIPVLDAAVLSGGLEGGDKDRTFIRLVRKWHRQGFEQQWNFSEGDWRLAYWARKFDTRDAIKMSVEGSGCLGGTWTIRFDSQNQSILGTESIDPSEFRANPTHFSDPPTYDVTPISRTNFPQRSFRLSAAEYQTYQEANEAGQIRTAIRPQSTELALSDPSWESTVNAPNGIINPGPPLDISSIPLNSQMAGLFAQLQPFYVKPWDSDTGWAGAVPLTLRFPVSSCDYLSVQSETCMWYCVYCSLPSSNRMIAVAFHYSSFARDSLN